MGVRAILLTLLLFCLSLAYSQKITIDKVEENRSTEDGFFSNRCEISLKISGDEVRKYKSLKVSKLIKAVDQQGFDLIDPEFEADYEDISNTTATTKLKTKIASRKSNAIKELSGEIKMFNPTEANGGIIKIKNYTTKTNVNLTPGIIGTKVVYITKASYDKIKKEKSAQQEAELKKLPKEAQEVATLLMNLGDSFGYVDWSENQAIFIFEGDASKLVDLYFEDNGGKRIDGNGSMTSGDMKIYYYNEPLKASWKMVLHVESPNSVKILPFKLTNIDLP